MAYTFEQVFAADPANPSNIAQNASITIFAPGDGTMTPIAITDPDGQPLANPIPVNANGFGSAFMADIDRVAWAGGGFTGFFTSYEGMKNEAVSAREAAESAAATAGAEAIAIANAAIGTATVDAETAAANAATAASNASASATAAANAAALVGAPADTAIAAAVNGSETATKAALNAAYAGKQAAPTSAAAAGIYDRRLNVYNYKPAQVFRLRAALAKANAGTAFANIGFNGDSTVAGTNGGNTPGTNAWPILFRNLLTTLGYPSSGTGIVAAYRAASASDPRWTYGAGWGGASGSSSRVANSTTTNALTFASTETGTQTHVFYSNTSGPFTVSIDGGAAVPVTPTGATTMGVLTSGALADTTHTLSIVRTSGTVEIFGVELRKAQTGVRIYNAGIAGAKAASVADTNWNSVSQTVAGGASAQFTADGIFLCCEINDMTGGGGAVVPAATYKTQMQTAITNLKVNGASLVLITGNPVSTGDFTDYTKALYELADTNDLPLVDIQDRWGSYAAANARAIMGDTVHPSPAGNAEIARAVLNALGL